ncbi:symmetrical bis(5'-nucleosyl)-tetraphosphatase [Glaciecola sp. KUL10]|uniref:symmetrical bis(5'-nucleosyl)-tetraphosphatase n=1 Tax=Glaciecola sp. (strain KUL10) TaxID=2161813 RepID=UPI000D7863D3|nr:symmetrical bis(5'-nucleosyl)-tetraphosphatase [Glaciecola sp. KUL10]GBL06112.1 bis(5'-nucleosyl)-tetraphosphatase [Glaciecola sp. KUL10]
MNYVVGDIQGCLHGLQKLLKKVKFDPKHDKLWAVGDLVARGPSSLETLRYLKSMGSSFETVLGNHDLHLIAIYHQVGRVKTNDLLDDLISAHDFEDLIKWLSSKPLAIRIDKQHLLSHAGLYPAWSFKQAIRHSNEVSDYLKSKKAIKFLKSMYGNEPSTWDDKIEGMERLRFITNAFTRMRFLNDKQGLDFKQKCHPSNAPLLLTPWFKMKNTQLKKHHKVVFGHWASLSGDTHSSRFIALDTGYVWGKSMSMYCIENQKIFSISA